VKGQAPGTEQPQSSRAMVYDMEYLDINGEP